MKLLLLSLCGKTKQPEDTGYLNLYLASLKRYVVPFFDVKVILLNNAINENSNESLTLQRVKEFGLENVVEVKNIYEMGLPEESVKFVDGLHWFNKIGVNMNMLFDYAKMNNFFGADWVFHFDTDIEFLPNFEQMLLSIEQMRKTHPEIMITAAGDTYPYNFRYKDTSFSFEEPPRISIYDASTITDKVNTRAMVVNRNIVSSDSSFYDNEDKLFFNLQQQKIRNDFVGYSLEAAKRNVFNWVSCFYNLNPLGDDHETDEDLKFLNKLLREKLGDQFVLSISHDKGSLPQYKLQGANHNVIKIQVRGYTDMAKHFGSGWYDVTTYREYSEKRLKEDYQDTQDIWDKDYLTKEEIESKILNLQNEIQRLQAMLN